MDEITTLLDRIGELSDGELSDLEGKVLTEFDTVEKADPTPQTVDQMTGLADALDAVRTEQTRRRDQAAELSRRREELTQRVRGANEDGGTEGEPQEQPEEAAAQARRAGEASEVDPNEIAKSAAEHRHLLEAGNEGGRAADRASQTDADQPGRQPDQLVMTNDSTKSSLDEDGSPVIQASGGRIQAPADRRPLARVEAPVAIIAGADIPGVTAGQPLQDMPSVAKAMVQRMHGMRRTTGGDGEQHTIATLVASFPEDRVLKSNDFEGNTSKIEKLASPRAITAAGGLCAPVDVRYDLYGLGVNDRPVKDALPTFSADRGGIRFVTPPKLGDLSGGVSLWTLQDDIDAGTAGAPDPVKPCLRVNCGPEVVVYTDAIPLCLTFGNLNSRAYPELVQRHNELALIEHARFSEMRLLTRIGALSTAVTAARQISATSDFFATLDRAATSYRGRHRTGFTFPLRFVGPTWLKDMFRADLAKMLDTGNNFDRFQVADSMIDAWFRARNINTSWALDGETGQNWGSQSAGALLSWPANVIYYLFSEGTFLFLDGGTLDLGLVRDSTLNATNDYKMFVETFEGVARIGLESLRITQPLVPTGQLAGTVDTSSGNG